MQIDNRTIDAGSPRSERQNPKAPYPITNSVAEVDSINTVFSSSRWTAFYAKQLHLITTILVVVIVTTTNMYGGPAKCQTQF